MTAACINHNFGLLIKLVLFASQNLTLCCAPWLLCTPYYSRSDGASDGLHVIQALPCIIFVTVFKPLPLYLSCAVAALEALLKPGDFLELSRDLQRRQLPDRSITKDSVRSLDNLQLSKDDTAALLTLKKALTSEVRKLLQGHKKGQPRIAAGTLSSLRRLPTSACQLLYVLADWPNAEHQLILVLCNCSNLLMHIQLLNHRRASCCADLGTRQPCAGTSDSGAAVTTSEAADSLDTVPAAGSSRRKRGSKESQRKAAYEDRAFYKDMSDRNSHQSLQYHHSKRHEKWKHRSSSLCMVVSHLGNQIVKQSTYGAAFRSDAANASRIGSLLNQIRAELQISVRSLHTQPQEPHEAAAVSSEGAAEAALLHQPAEAAAAALPSQAQPEPQQPLGPRASTDQPYSRQRQVRLHVTTRCAGH